MDNSTNKEQSTAIVAVIDAINSLMISDTPELNEKALIKLLKFKQWLTEISN